MLNARRHTLLVSIALAALFGAPAARAQEREPPRFRLGGIMAGGVRKTTTEGWGRLDFRVTNLTDWDGRARVLAFYANQQDLQYGRDLWVPAHSSIAAWLPLGPAPAQALGSSRELQFLLQDLAEGKDRLVLPATEQRVRAGGVIYRQREPTTALVVDMDVTDGNGFGELPLPDSPADEAFALVRAYRSAGMLSEHVQVLDQGSLPPWPRAFGGIDHLVLASGRVADDPAGLRGLRRWVEQGGQVWVMLDRVGADVLAPLLGEALDFQVVGRVSLTDFRIDEQDAVAGAVRGPAQQHERGVDFVRVLLPSGESTRHTVDGWPVWFTRALGRGKVVFTTVGPRGWYRPRTAGDPQSPFPQVPSLPVPGEPLVLLAEELRVRSAEPYPIAAFESLLAQEIGYVIVGRSTVAIIFAAFLAAALVLSMLARGSRKPELLGWVGPAAALTAAAVFVAFGEVTRRAAPPTVAVAQVIDGVAGTDEAAFQGLLAIYRPDSGPVAVGAERGGFFELDMAGIEGQTRRLIMTDMDAWHWENLVMPAGVRFAPFQFTARTGEPIHAVASFGPAGLEGHMVAKGLQNLADGLVTSPGARNVALRLQPDGAFSVGNDDVLPADQFVAGTLYSDQQQRRQEIYRHLLKRSATESLSRAPVVMAWADPMEMPFFLVRDARMVGTALVSVPLRFKHSAPDTHVMIPGTFVSIRRVLDGRLTRPQRESSQAAEMHLRFQLPAAVLPFAVESARLVTKIDARARRITISGRAEGALVELLRVENPLGPIVLPIADQQFLRLDADGGLHLSVTLSEPLQGGAAGPANAAAASNWTIEYMELEVIGRTASESATKK